MTDDLRAAQLAIVSEWWERGHETGRLDNNELLDRLAALSQSSETSTTPDRADPERRADFRGRLVAALRDIRQRNERRALAGEHPHLTDEDLADQLILALTPPPAGNELEEGK